MEADNNKNKTPIKKLSAVVIVLAVVVVVLWVVNLVVSLNQANNSSNLLGDSFGIVNSLFSGIAVILVFYSVQIQKKELKETNDAFEAQNTLLKIQKFEGTFFNMLQQLREIGEQFNETEQNSLTNSKEGFDIRLNSFLATILFYHEEFYSHIKDKKNVSDTDVDIDKLSFIRHEFSKGEVREGKTIFRLEEYERELRYIFDYEFKQLYWRYSYYLSHFYRYFEYTLEFVYREFDKAEDAENRLFYSNLITAQLSTAQLGLLFYYCISDVSKNKEGLNKLKEKVDDLNLLSNIESRIAFNNVRIAKMFYPKTEFGNFTDGKLINAVNFYKDII